jgi:hypothetical protein
MSSGCGYMISTTRETDMDYRIGKPIVTVRQGNPNVQAGNRMQTGLRLRVMDAQHRGRHGEQLYLVQKETAYHPMLGLFSVRPDEVDYMENTA